MRKGHSVVGARRAHVCEGEELDPSRSDQISWCQVVLVLSRPLGREDQFTVTASAGIRNHEKRVAEIVVREQKGTNLTCGGAYRLTKCGQLRRGLTCVLDTCGSASLRRFLVA